MQEAEIDRDYISPDLPLPTSGVSPLAMLQETCRNIGNDVPPRAREMHKSKIRHPANIATSRSFKGRAMKAPAVSNKIEVTCHQPVSNLPAPVISPMASTVQPPTSLPQTDYNSYSASQYQLLCQRLMYQTELEKLQSTPSSINPFIPSPTNYIPDPVSLRPPLNLSPPANSPLSRTDFAKLAAYFYHQLQQTSPPLNSTPISPTPTTEAFLNYRKLFSENNNGLLPPLSQEFQPAPSPVKPQLHQCHWVTSEGYCGKKHYSHEDLMLHLQSHAISSTSSSPSIFGSSRVEGPPSLISPTDYHSKLCRTQVKDNSKAFSRHQPLRYQPYNFLSRPLAVPYLH